MQNASFPSVEIRYIRYFVAVAEELNFWKASQRLHVSAPTVSIQIKKLEDVLEVQLFDRDTTHVRLTDLGEVFLRHSRKLLQSVDVLYASLEKAKQESHETLRIGLAGEFNANLITKALAIYRRRHPKVEVKLTGLKMDEEQAQALDEGRIHIGFAFNYNLSTMKNTEHFPILGAQVYAVMGTQHPLAAGKEVTMAELAAYPMLAMKNYKQHAEDIAALFRKNKLYPKVETCDTSECCAAMLASGEPVSLISDLRPMAHNPELTLRPIKDASPAIRMELNVVWRKNNTSPPVLNFLEVLRELRICPKDCACPCCPHIKTTETANCPQAAAGKPTNNQQGNKGAATDPCHNCYLSKQATCATASR